MDREAEAIGLPPQQGMRAVALMRVGVDDERPPPGMLGPEDRAGDRDVVEHAEAEPPVGERMMGAAAEVDRDAVVQGGAHGQDRAMGLPPTTVQQRGVVRQAEPVAVEHAQPSFPHRIEVAAVMHQPEHLPRRGLRGKEDGAAQLGFQQGAAAGELVHGERMLRRQGVVVERVMETAEAHAVPPKVGRFRGESNPGSREGFCCPPNPVIVQISHPPDP